MGVEVSKLPDWICKSSILSHNEDEIVTKVCEESVDPRLPLTVRQKFKLQKSWKGVRREMKSTGLELFLRYVAKKN